MENISSETISRENSGTSVCPKCHAPVSTTENFCPQCGAKLKEPPLSISVGRQIFIYLISFFLAPFGLGYAFKYLKQSNPEARKIGIIVVVLTVVAITLMIWITYAFTNWEFQSINVL